MTSQSSVSALGPKELADYGFGRVRDIAFDAVRALWTRRKSEGWKQNRIAEAIDMPEARLSKYLSGPGNWTLRTLGELVEGLDGEIEITIRAKEDVRSGSNYDAYDADVVEQPDKSKRDPIQEDGNQGVGDRKVPEDLVPAQ